MARLFVAAALVLSLTACDATRETPTLSSAGAPEAIDTVRVAITGPGATQTTRTLVVTGFASGSPVAEPATLALPAGSYAARITVSQAVQAEIEAEAESHVVSFSPADEGASASATATDRESQYTPVNLNDGDYPVGLAFQLSVSGPPGTAVPVGVRLGHLDGPPKTATTSASDGSADVTFTMPLVIAGG